MDKELSSAFLATFIRTIFAGHLFGWDERDEGIYYFDKPWTGRHTPARLGSLAIDRALRGSRAPHNPLGLRYPKRIAKNHPWLRFCEGFDSLAFIYAMRDPPDPHNASVIVCLAR